MLLALLFHLPFRPTHHDLSTGGPQKFATRHSISTPETFCNSEHCKVLGLSHTELTGSRSLTHRDDLTHESSRAGTEFGHYMNHSGERAISRPICKSTSSSMDACVNVKGFLSQDRAPLPLLPDIMEIMRRSLRSRQCINIAASPQPAPFGLTSPRTIHKNGSETAVSFDTAPHFEMEPPRACPSPASPSTELQSSGNTSNFLTPISKNDVSTSSGGSKDVPSTAFGECCNGPGNVIPAVHQDSGDVTSKNTVHAKDRCWDHGCNGKKFSTRSNLLRHHIEMGNARPRFNCTICGAFFSRTTARDQHVEKKSCNRIRRYSNGRERPLPPRRSMKMHKHMSTT
ncbi:hypothetical protein B5807_12056 [Epicoccum nigrum]|uniref:C2H2-type domain-containing protein n=1 Tax=Epicoccum nigrum TaxID=105696 RepID=A0A1Y2LH12_EPING|nr:hypothetical protein B5807_12056 [Epicoccum nigrum]